ncbi:hypothetical protein [Puia sp.]
MMIEPIVSQLVGDEQTDDATGGEADGQTEDGKRWERLFPREAAPGGA